MIEDPGHSPLFSAAYAAWLLAQRASNVVQRYVLMLERTRDLWLQRQGDHPLAEIGPDAVRHWLLWLQGGDPDCGIPAPHGKRTERISGAYVDIQFRNIKAFFTWTEEEEVVYRSPMRKVKRPRFEERLPEALSEAEADELLHKVKTNGDRHAYRDYCIFLLFLDTGVRLAELVRLDVDHVNLVEGYAKVYGKGRRERIVPVGVELRQAISLYLLKHREAVKGETALFVNEHGLRLESRGVSSTVIRDLNHYVARKLNHYGPHTLRHTSITFRLRKTRDLKTTSLISGHSTTRTTERYVHLTGADVLRDAAGSAMDDIVRNRAGKR